MKLYYEPFFSFILIIIILYLLLVKYRLNNYCHSCKTTKKETFQNNSNSNSLGNEVSIESIENPLKVKLVWQSKLPNNNLYLSFFEREPENNLFPMGQYCTFNNNKLDALPDEEFINAPILSLLVNKGKHPIQFNKIWSSDLLPDNQKLDTDLSIWQPIPPEGFISMGDIAVPSLSPPNKESVVCLPLNQLINNSQIKSNIYSNELLSIWKISNYGAFFANNNINSPQHRKDNVFDISETLMKREIKDPLESNYYLDMTISQIES